MLLFSLRKPLSPPTWSLCMCDSTTASTSSGSISSCLMLYSKVSLSPPVSKRIVSSNPSTKQEKPHFATRSWSYWLLSYTMVSENSVSGIGSGEGASGGTGFGADAGLGAGTLVAHEVRRKTIKVRRIVYPRFILPRFI